METSKEHGIYALLRGHNDLSTPCKLHYLEHAYGKIRIHLLGELTLSPLVAMSSSRRLCLHDRHFSGSDVETARAVRGQAGKGEDTESLIMVEELLKFTRKFLYRTPYVRKVPDTFNFLRHVMRAIWSVRPKCSHRCVSLKETPLKPVQSLKHTTKNSAEQTVMRTKWFKHIAI